MDRVTDHWSGKCQRVAQGSRGAGGQGSIPLCPPVPSLPRILLWTDGTSLIPCDFRAYDKPQGGKIKKAHFQ